MNDNDHARAIRNAVLAINNHEALGDPLYDAYYAAVKAAEEDGLKVAIPRSTEIGEPFPQPQITRTLTY